MTTKLNSLPPEYKSKISAISLPYSPSNTVLPLVRRLLFCWPKTFLISSSTNINTNRRPLAFETYSRRFLFFFFVLFLGFCLGFFATNPTDIWHLPWTQLNSTNLHILWVVFIRFFEFVFVFSFWLLSYNFRFLFICSYIRMSVAKFWCLYFFFFFNKTVNIWCRLRNYGLWKVSVSF